MASLPISRGSTYSSSDTDDSDAGSAMLASCSLQEIRQEDLAAILPDQQECDAFGGFETRPDKISPQTGKCACCLEQKAQIESISHFIHFFNRFGQTK